MPERRIEFLTLTHLAGFTSLTKTNQFHFKILLWFAFPPSCVLYDVIDHLLQLLIAPKIIANSYQRKNREKGFSIYLFLYFLYHITNIHWAILSKLSPRRLVT